MAEDWFKHKAKLMKFEELESDWDSGYDAPWRLEHAKYLHYLLKIILDYIIQKEQPN